LATSKKTVTKKRVRTASSASAVRKPASKAVPVEKKVQATVRKTTPPAGKSAPLAAGENPLWLTAIRAAESKKAIDVKVLDLREVTSFADFFVICSGTNPRQVQAIAEEIDRQLAKRGERATSLEGFKNGEWVLADYGDMIVHVFSPTARAFYDLERLWRHAKNVDIPTES
jgi:ribosome-associated protein